jgi:hypothetical protein
MDSVLASSAIDCGYEPRSCQTKEYRIGICCFFAKNAALRRKSKDWLARNQNNVSVPRSETREKTNRQYIYIVENIKFIYTSFDEFFLRLFLLFLDNLTVSSGR